MGDRANVVVRGYGDDDIVYLYTHWGGRELAEVVTKALTTEPGKSRLTDSPYLTRIIFEQMVGDKRGTETGFGISAVLTDNEYPLVVLDVARQRAHLAPESAAKDMGSYLATHAHEGWPFADLVLGHLTTAYRGTDDEAE